MLIVNIFLKTVVEKLTINFFRKIKITVYDLIYVINLIIDIKTMYFNNILYFTTVKFVFMNHNSSKYIHN